MADWRNWSGSVAASPQQFVKPSSEDSLAKLVSAAKKVRVVGAGHSFMPLCETTGVLVNLDDYPGELTVSADRTTVWAPAGWRLFRLTEALWAQGLSLMNQGDIDEQSLAGAVSTATHGTGAALGSLATQARGFRLMLADGTLVECSPTQLPELYEAQRLSLGLFGVVTEICMAVVPAYHLEERNEIRPLDEVLDQIDDLVARHRHIEFFSFPYSDNLIVKTLQPIAAERSGLEPHKGNERVLDLLYQLGAESPRLIPDLQQVIARPRGALKSTSGPAYKVFASKRDIRFQEMEYQVPSQDGAAVFRELIGEIRAKEIPINFPLEFRFVAADDIWISPFNTGQKASISLHQYGPMDWREPFSQLEPVFRSAQGRPHWAKRHSLTNAHVEQMYPRLADFLRTRQHYDPGQKFLNESFQTLFGV